MSDPARPEPDSAEPAPRDLMQWARSIGVVPLVMAAATLGLPLLMVVVFARIREQVEAGLAALGAAAPAAYALGLAILTGVALSPTWLLALFSGYLFGPVMGSVAAVSGVTGGAAIGFLLAKTIASERVRASIAMSERAEAIRSALVDRRFRDEVFAIALVRFPPNSPFAATNLALAVVGAKFWPFIVATPIGMAPRTILAAVLGALGKAANENFGDVLENQPNWVRVAGIVLLLAVLIAIYQIFSRWITAALPEHLRNRGGPAPVSEHTGGTDDRSPALDD